MTAVGRLEAPVRRYAWGSRTALAGLQGRPAPTAHPEAELWMGAHPADPALLERGGAAAPLDEVIAADPAGELGADVVDAFGPTLPFLLKVLAADEPLSLQAHPSAEQAAAGFAEEEARGIPIDAPHRNYRDRWPKPELLCALSPFDALCGFRPVAETLELLDALDVPRLAPMATRLRAEGEAAYRPVVRALLAVPAAERAALVEGVAAGARRAAARGVSPDVAGWVTELAARYPDDPGVAVALCLRLVHLEPGQALFLPAGNLHAYLRGTGVEVMACSDNVLRGGLTPKHVDVEALLAVLDGRVLPPPRVEPVAASPHELVYPAPAREFRLSRVSVDGGAVALDRRGGEILLCLDGAVTVTADADELRLTPGTSAFVAARAAEVALTGPGTVVRATPGLSR